MVLPWAARLVLQMKPQPGAGGGLQVRPAPLPCFVPLSRGLAFSGPASLPTFFSQWGLHKGAPAFSQLGFCDSPLVNHIPGGVHWPGWTFLPPQLSFLANSGVGSLQPEAGPGQGKDREEGQRMERSEERLWGCSSWSQEAVEAGDLVGWLGTQQPPHAP